MLLINGYAKLKLGTGAFVTMVSPSFADSLLPSGLVDFFLTLLPTLETVLGALLVLGLFTTLAARLTALLFAIFIIGFTAQQSAETGGLIIGFFIFMYAAFKLVCASHSPISLDHLKDCKGGKCMGE